MVVLLLCMAVLLLCIFVLFLSLGQAYNMDDALVQSTHNDMMTWWRERKSVKRHILVFAHGSIQN